MKQTVSETALALVEKKLPQVNGRLTPQDAATATGITFDEAQGALARLMELYVTRVTNDDEGNILFAFEYPLRRRGTKTAAEKWAEVKDRLWHGFKLFFKVWIGVMLIAYFAVMVVIVIALLFARRAADRDGDGDDVGDMLGGLFRVIGDGLQYAFWWRIAAPPIYAVDDYGYRHRSIRTPRDAKGKGKSFVIGIYDLALGPERAAADPLGDEQEIAAYLRASKGVLAPAEIVALSGVTINQAEERMADYLVRFKGDPDITDEGVVLGEFDAFVTGTSARTDARIVPYWDEFEAPYEHSGNSAGRNAAIIAMVLFTLASGVGLLGGGLETLTRFSMFFASTAAHILLGYIPIAFSLLYLAIALLRLPIAKRKESERLARNREKKVLRAIFQQRMWRASADAIYFAMVAAGEKELKREDIPAILERILLRVQGDVELDQEGQPIYVFDRLQREIEASERLRDAK